MTGLIAGIVVRQLVEKMVRTFLTTSTHGEPRSNYSRLVVDQVIPTNRPDVMVFLEKERKIVLFEVACAWEQNVHDRETEKRAKYGELVADLVK